MLQYNNVYKKSSTCNLITVPYTPEHFSTFLHSACPFWALYAARPNSCIYHHFMLSSFSIGSINYVHVGVVQCNPAFSCPCQRVCSQFFSSCLQQSLVALVNGQLVCSDSCCHPVLSLCAGGNGALFNGSNGGRDIVLDGNIVLCGRADPAAGNRSYDGALTSLSLFDTALLPAAIEDLYNQASQPGSALVSLDRP